MTSGRDSTATRLTKKRPKAPKRVATPSTSSTGSPISPAVPSTAATMGDNTGTWYSFSNSAMVVSQSRSLVRPDRKKTLAT